MKLESMFSPSENYLTHVIEGFVIKESEKPLETIQVSMKNDDSLALCEQCKSTQVKSVNDRFCSSSCIKRYEKKRKNRDKEESKSKHKHRKHHHCSKKHEESKKVKRKKKEEEKIEEQKEINVEGGIKETAEPIEAINTCPPIINTDSEMPDGDPTEWDCDQVHEFVKNVAGPQVAHLFKSQEVDGSALNLIRDDHLVTTMQIKLGPALKIMSKFNELKHRFNSNSNKRFS